MGIIYYLIKTPKVYLFGYRTPNLINQSLVQLQKTN